MDAVAGVFHEFTPVSFLAGAARWREGRAGLRWSKAPCLEASMVILAADAALEDLWAYAHNCQGWKGLERASSPSAPPIGLGRGCPRGDEAVALEPAVERRRTDPELFGGKRLIFTI